MRRPASFLLLLTAAAMLAGCNDHDTDKERGNTVAANRQAEAPASGIGTTQDGAADDVRKPGHDRSGKCGDLPTTVQLHNWLNSTPAEGEVGGFAGGRHEWAAVVDRQGRLCAVASADADPTMPWPGSLGIAKAKAFTANAFSSDTTPMSTARLYTMAQPGHSLFGAGAGDPLNPKCLQAPGDASADGTVCGGVIVFGGGLPLYRDKTKVGGLGVSGDTPCADQEIAKRVRHAAKLDPVGGATVDDITYSSVDGASIYTHPLCYHTWRNGQKIGEEPVASGY
ncbi:GlcG/HbpS family heme-binding protein [Dyella sp. KRB-257]|uniref:GlcG/HbpS family heme-binding protein n=1 Tax=Dyella sp. KRB-257 TaxID=3400915 RepID=UPI003C0BA86A